MTAIQGYFIKNTFVSPDGAIIPDGRRAIVTLLDENAPEYRCSVLELRGKYKGIVSTEMYMKQKQIDKELEL